MADRYGSIDEIQCALADGIFVGAKASKKAAGRALGTLVEVVTYYLLKAWGLEQTVAIERPIIEYANSSISHNVEFTLHRSTRVGSVKLAAGVSPTANRLYKDLQLAGWSGKAGAGYILKDGVVKNAFTVANSTDSFVNAYLNQDRLTADAFRLDSAPFAMIECKRVGVEEGMKKGPQTIEKAKQGSYVARAVSGVQRFRFRDGGVGAVMEDSDGNVETFDDYYHFLDKAIASKDPVILQNLILTIGVVSDHGNWFASDNLNKEMKVLAQSYDWLLFLTDAGLSSFVHQFLVSPDKDKQPVKNAFDASYGPTGKNRFTKTRMDVEADRILTEYFNDSLSVVESWFNVITPESASMSQLQGILQDLASVELGEP